MELILPGALWPNAEARDFAPIERYPTLARWLGQSDIEPLALSYQEILVQRLGVGNTSPALLRWLGESTADDHADVDATLLCADPVHLYLAREHLVVTELGETAPSREEARALAATAQTVLQNCGATQAQVFPVAPTRWYVQRIPKAWLRDTALVPLPDASGRPWDTVLPQGRQQRLWLRLANELQVELAQHPVNRARESAGLPPVHMLWFWGHEPLQPQADATIAAPEPQAPTPAASGALPPQANATTPAPRASDASDTPTVLIARTADPLLVGAVRASGFPFRIADMPPASTRDQTLAILDVLAEPARLLDHPRWLQALEALDTRWLRTLRRAPRTIVLAGSRASLVARPRRWRFWPSPRGLDALGL